MVGTDQRSARRGRGRRRPRRARAARELAAAGRDAVVLEARDRVGGRTLNEPIGDGKVVEIGAQWVGPTQDRVLALIRELGLETFPTHAARQEHLRARWAARPATRARSRAQPDRARRGRAWRWSGSTRWRRGFRRGAVEGGAGERLGLRRPSPAGCAATCAPRPPATSCAWRSSASGRPSRATYRCSTCSSTSARPARSRSCIDTEGGAQQDRVVGGTQLISMRMAEELDDAVELGSPVRAIGHDADAVAVRSDRVDGARAARDRRDPADARRADRLRAGAAGGARRALPADGAGQRGQVHGGLRRARSGASAASPGR